MKFNKDKQVGNILFIVEGEKTEFEVLKRIFCYVLDYQYVEKKRNKPERFIGKNNSNNRIYVVNTRESNISFIFDYDYLDKIFEMLINNYELNLDNTAIFYLFDRDYESNTNVDLIREYIQKLRDPYDNDDEKGGLLLLSYPSIESYVVSNFLNLSYTKEMRLGADVKEFMGQEPNRRIIQFNRLSEDTLKFACNEFQNYMSDHKFKFDLDLLDLVNSQIFESEEEHYSLYQKNHLVSLVSVVLLYLGIIELEEDDCLYFTHDY